MLKLFSEYLNSVYPILWAPVISVIVFLVCLLCRLAAKRKNRKHPGAVKDGTLQALNKLTKVFGIIAIVTVIVIVGGLLLLNAAVAYM